MKLMRPGEANKRGNIVTARIVPAFLLGIIGYSSWVVTKLVCVDYLIDPVPSIRLRKQTGAAVAILTIYYLLLLFTLICFGRLLQTITVNAGLVPRGSQWYIEEERVRRTQGRPSRKEEGLEFDSPEGYTPRHLRRRHREEKAGYRAQDFWRKDVFVCGFDGRPPFCSTCYNYKPDRAHHCSELGRCVLKMDHFCPWVGGIVSETSFKYFIQFTFWAALYCLHTMICMAYYFARRRSQESFLNVHWILVLIFAALFFVFTLGMCGSSLQFAFINSTTIENFTRKTKIWYLAIYVPERVFQRYNSSGRTDLRFITYPRPPAEQFQTLKQNGVNPNDSEQNVSRQPWDPNSPTPTPTPPPNAYSPQARSTFPPHPWVAQNATWASTQPHQDLPSSFSPPGTAFAATETRTFAILESTPGANPFDVGPHGNFQEVMGYTIFDWFVPLRPSPLVDHSDPTSMYRLGPVVKEMVRKAGIEDVTTADGEDGYGEGRSEKRTGKERRHKKKRRRRRSTTTTTTSGNQSHRQNAGSKRRTDGR